jgi:hypothetical protein
VLDTGESEEGRERDSWLRADLVKDRREWERDWERDEDVQSSKKEGRGVVGSIEVSQSSMVRRGQAGAPKHKDVSHQATAAAAMMDDAATRSCLFTIALNIFMVYEKQISLLLC